MLSLLAIASILYLLSDIDNSEYIMRRIYLNKEVKYTTGGIISEDILINQTRNQKIIIEMIMNISIWLIKRVGSIIVTIDQGRFWLESLHRITY